MRRLILQMQMSLDGFVGGPDGEVDWVFPGLDEEYAQWGAAELWKAGAHLMGSVTYRDMAAHWPTSTEPYAAPMNEVPKIVFSRSLGAAEWPETRIIAGELAPAIADLKREPGKDLLAHGGARFARSLVATGQIDVYRLIVHPVALGKGFRLFHDRATPMRLRLSDLREFRTGVVAKTFEPA